jgi:hypothetical protein
MTTRFLPIPFLIGAAAAFAADPVAAVKPAVPAKTVTPLGRPAAPASTLAPTGSFDTFRIVNDRNIFNAYRTGRRDASSGDNAPRSDVIALVGTMDYEKGLIAFFDGSTATYRRALHVGESVGPIKVTAISADRVDVERDGKPFTLQVGQQFRRPEGGDWDLVAAEVVRAEAAQAAQAQAQAASAAAAPAIPANADPILKKLLEARQNSLKQ